MSKNPRWSGSIRQRSQTTAPSATDEESALVFGAPASADVNEKTKQQRGAGNLGRRQQQPQPPPSCRQLVQHCLTVENWKRAWIWAKQNRRLVCGILIAIPFILRPSRLWKWRYHYFGKHNIHGGELGQRYERWGYLQRFDEVQAQQERHLQSLGIVLPPRSVPVDRSTFRVLKLDTQAALRDILVRREERAQTLATLERQAPVSACAHDSLDEPVVKKTAPNTTITMGCRIPQVLFVPEHGVLGGWQPPRAGKSVRYKKLMFDEREMRQLVMDVRPDLLPLMDGLNADHVDRVYVWAVCAVYHFGGVFVANGGGGNGQSNDLLQSLLWSEDSKIVDKTVQEPLAVVIVDQLQQQEQQPVQLIAATPRHPALLCALNNWQQMALEGPLDTLATGHGGDGGFKRLERLFHGLLPFAFKDTDSNQVNGWTQVSLQADKQSLDACRFDTTSLASFPEALATESKHGDPAHLYCLLQAANTENHYNLVVEPSKVEVRVRLASGKEEQPDALSSTKQQKVTLETQLQQHGLEPGWLCMRCTKVPQYGQMERCTRYCPAGYTDLVCHGPDIPQKKNVSVQVIVQGYPTTPPTIPKRIHQTWFENVSPDRYPQMSRLQNSWKNTGWTYTLYTDKTAREYIVEHFPLRFVEAFDALIPGAFKADLFRYLVLLREGGVYADVDVKLDTNLDRYLTPSLSFFAPRDVVLEFAGEPFCLWNGLIGAAPGHPFIARAVERLVNLILDRADVFDMERDLCRDAKQDEPLDLWKVRMQTLLLLSGPCGLGVAVNEALGRPPLQPIETGWMGLDQLEFGGDRRDHGDALIMIGDKHDLGGFRMSDPERNLLVASTDLLESGDKLAREIRNPTQAEQAQQQQRKPRELIHYSESDKHIYVWGSSGVYTDKQVTNERIEFDTRYSN